MKYTGDELLWIAICDDEEKSVMEIKDILMEGEVREGDFKISVFSSGEALMKANISRYNLLILDIMFPGKSGREVAKEYRVYNENGLLVFCTGKCTPTAEDFKVLPYRYMRKDSIRQMRTELLETVEEMYRRKTKEQLKVSQGKTSFFLPIEDILYLEIEKNGSNIYYFDATGNVSKLKVRETLKELYPYLFTRGFEFAHHSYLVNCNFMVKLDSHELELIEGTRISVSRAKEKTFKQTCMKYIS